MSVYIKEDIIKKLIDSFKAEFLVDLIAIENDSDVSFNKTTLYLRKDNIEIFNDTQQLRFTIQCGSGDLLLSLSQKIIEKKITNFFYNNDIQAIDGAFYQTFIFLYDINDYKLAIDYTKNFSVFVK